MRGSVLVTVPMQPVQDKGRKRSIYPADGWKLLEDLG
jgi:hypothetical protein